MGSGNKRGIQEFSMNAKRNMMYLIARVKRDCLPCFVTLTYPKEFSLDGREWKRDLKNFLTWLGNFSGVSAIWKLEPQRRGAPHFHLLIWGVSVEVLQDTIPERWYKLVGDGDIKHLQWHKGELGNINCVVPVDSTKTMYNYVMKYISKSLIEGWQNVGKWWGVYSKNNLPVGEEVLFEIREKDVNQIMRYMRRFTRHSSCNNASRQIVCDADQWLEKIQCIPMGSYRDWLKKLENI